MSIRIVQSTLLCLLIGCADAHDGHHHIPPEVERQAQNLVFPLALGQADYGPANWIKSPNYSTSNRGKGKITTVVVHTVQGSYNGCISWFQNPSAKVSAHYVISKSGQVTQMVKEKDVAWHVGSQNGYTVGIEHEGWVSDANWATPAMVTASAKLTCYLVKKYGLTATKTHIKGHVELPKQTHTDPGKYWPWESYLNQVSACVKGTGGSSGPVGPTCPSSCDDGNACTDDTCVSGICKSTYANGKVCWDGDACTAGESCKQGKCVGGAIVKNCDDNNPCTVDGCSSGACTHQAKSLPCDDGDPCTLKDLCKSGSCIGGTTKICNDGNPCTEDACVGGQCVTTATTGGCDDGDPCTVKDSCKGGQCTSGVGTNCDDGDPCTVGEQCDKKSGQCTSGLKADCTEQGPCVTGVCDPKTGCLPANDGQSCDDGDPCTQATRCKAGQCDGGSKVDCNDGNPCTHDSCNVKGCLNLPHAQPCDDGQACTLADICVGSVCKGQLISCDDGDPCTTAQVCVQGQCTAGKGVCDDGNDCTRDHCTAGQCNHKPLVSDCDDSDQCTIQSYCKGELCQGGVPIDCDDGDPCTSDRCVSTRGCLHDIGACAADAAKSVKTSSANDGVGSGGCAARPRSTAPASPLNFALWACVAALIVRRRRRI